MVVFVLQPGMKPEEKGGFPPAGVPVLAEDPHPVPECVKKMSVNQNTGETILHKAARLGYEVWYQRWLGRLYSCSGSQSVGNNGMRPQMDRTSVSRLGPRV